MMVPVLISALTVAAGASRHGIARVLERFRLRYVLSITRGADAAPAWHRLDVRLDPSGGTVTARPGYFGA